MNFKSRIIKTSIVILISSIVITSCQKLTRPTLGDYPKDPPTPPYNAQKSSFSFENNLNDDGEDKLSSTSSNITYVAGITGQAVNIGSLGYILFPLKDTITNSDGFVSIPRDTLANLGSFTLSFWMNGTGTAGGPVSDGAEGLFAISNKDQFWGNLELFLENYTDATDPNAVWLKIHMFNGTAEEWTADDNTKLKDVLNKWTHIALTYDASTSSLSLYKDGAATAVNNKILGGGTYGKLKFDGVSGMSLGTFAFQTNPSLTNHGPESWAQSFHGALDQFHLYNKSMTSAEILDLYNSKQ